MNKNYIIPNEWSIIENGFDAENVEASESLFSIGNGSMGQRANFEEDYSGSTFQGSYIGGIYYPDKTRVGWWKNGYPEYFAKVLNAPNWIGIHIAINGTKFDLNTCKISNFKRELNMKEGWLGRSFNAQLKTGEQIEITAKRFVSIDFNETGAIEYHIKALNFSGEITYAPYIDAGIENEDSNYDEFFWEILEIVEGENSGCILSKTLKTEFHVSTAMQIALALNNEEISVGQETKVEAKKLTYIYKINVKEGDIATIYKFGSYVSSLNYKNSALNEASLSNVQNATELGFQELLNTQIRAWANIWKTADIVIEGDVKAQQGIRFNIFQLNQTYLGTDARLNIGPKGFTGEKYGGSTYWDTEAYCIPFYMATKDDKVAKNLLLYRYNQLDKAIENAEKLGFKNGAALYPMVTMNGEECHNEWEITFEEIHRNGAMVYGIYNYVNYTQDFEYIPKNGLEVMIAIARFWHQRANFSEAKNKYVILGVTGPNEYENNINNNFYTNYLAKWCIEYTVDCLNRVKKEYTNDFDRVISKTNLTAQETSEWLKVADNMYFPFDEEKQLFLQQDGFLDKEIIPVNELPKSERPINQKWSWDRILRSCYIKQADVLQCFYFFENKFSTKELENHFDFYEPITVHESSLSPCVHAILAASIDRMPKAYEQYLRTARLDLDDYNHEVHEGCHITSMAGTWMSVVQGFGGMRVWEDGMLSFNPQIPAEWKSYSFTINFRGNIIKVYKSQTECKFFNESRNEVKMMVANNEVLIPSNEFVII
ncbi:MULTISPECIES: family 65 glycosyl hydrolase domain-containing protein [Flavobacteriaceae]|uniref:Glycoside hydrolase family 65 protein n=2 Tax=Flavobacteriaceae TaxID=49546 RepID=A0A4Y8AQG7_9FLAO|nr:MULTISPECIES: family 65 glycosyl hydrolase domain-containing protein [Flavobacteriaceae]TEW72195.1 glycoside hydrolase family 65 protein [Gramella jeungdoensis]GGK57131.1 maltose phosphorylase [Lutibacter litoralis]